MAANAIKYLMPAPNTGSADSFQNNYAVNFPAPISSNQFDVRIDQNITTNQSIYGRYTFKNRSVTTAPEVNCVGFCETSLSPLLGGIAQPEQDRGLTVAYNYTITPQRDQRVSWRLSTRLRTSLTADVNSATLISQVGITGIPDIADGAYGSGCADCRAATDGWAEHHQPAKQGHPVAGRSDLGEGKNTFKFGGDVRRLTDHDENVFGNYRAGQYMFNRIAARWGRRLAILTRSFCWATRMRRSWRR